MDQGEETDSVDRRHLSMSEYDPLTHNEDLALKEDIASHEWALYCVVNVDKELIQQENFGNFNCSLFCFILLFY